MVRLTREATAEPSRETEFSGANADREMFIFSVQLTTKWTTGNLISYPVDPYSGYMMYDPKLSSQSMLLADVKVH